MGYLRSLLEGFKDDPGLPFIVAFVVLLVLAAIYLAIGRENEANVLAEYAYYALVAGVVLELVAAVKEGDCGSGDSGKSCREVEEESPT